jgi:hypothetical protein
MGGERGGGGVASLALLISLIALVISILAYREAGGSLALKEQVQTLQSTLKTARKETADALERIERAVRPAERSGSAPAGPRR